MAGRPPASVSISNNVLNVNALQRVDYVPREIYDAMQDDNRLIQNTVNCGGCNGRMSLVRRAESPEGLHGDAVAAIPGRPSEVDLSFSSAICQARRL